MARQRSPFDDPLTRQPGGIGGAVTAAALPATPSTTATPAATQTNPGSQTSPTPGAVTDPGGGGRPRFRDFNDPQAYRTAVEAWRSSRGGGTTPGAPGPPTTPGAGTGTGTTTPAATTAGFDSSGTYKPQNDSVVDQVNKVVSTASPLMQRAQGIGMAVANSRGLQNSTLAGQAAMKSMLDAAVPIASQEAQQIYGKNLQFMQGKVQTTIAQMQAETSKQIAQMQVDSNMSVAQLQAAVGTQSAFSNALLASSQNYQTAVSAIMANPDMSAAARQAALSQAAAQRDADFAMLQKVYGVSLNGTPTPTGSTTTPGTTTGTTGSSGSSSSSSKAASNTNLAWKATPGLKKAA